MNISVLRGPKLNGCMFSAVSRDGTRSQGQCPRGRGVPRISGFLMTEPICLSACCPAFCTLTWESVSTSVSLGTMLGRQDDSCLGAQYAIAPSNSTDPADGRHMPSMKSLSTGWQVAWAGCPGKGHAACSSADCSSSLGKRAQGLAPAKRAKCS